MAYSFYDTKGYIGPGPSITGWRDVKKLLEEYKDIPRPALEQLIEHGHTNMLPALAVECRNLSNKTKDQDIKNTLKALSGLAKRAQEVIILEH
jgi:hypothetical protein